MITTKDEVKISEVEKILNTTFKDKDLLKQALIHKSWAIENKCPLYNERLEFLGDSVLSLIITHYLYRLYPTKDEGYLSKLKSILVSKTQFAKWASEINLGKYVYISSAEESSGGKKKDSILANMFEAVLGALYLDQGIKKCQQFIEERFLSKGVKIEFQDYKSIVQEIVQRKFKVLPVYEIVEETGPDHDKEFTTILKVEEKIFGKGRGKTKKQAEQEAARVAIKKLQKVKNTITEH